MNLRRWAAGALVLTLSGVLAGTRHTGILSAQEEEAVPSKGLQFRISPGKPEHGPDAHNARPPAIPLSASEVTALLRRLAPVHKQPGDRQAFAMREGSLPAPRTARTVEVPFPSPDKLPPPIVSSNRALEITSFAPEGDVEMAPHLAVSFNHPMVPVTSVDDLRAKDVPVHVTPQPEGKWRWLGTQTLMFVPTIRFPMSTEYHIDIPQGVASATGLHLAQAKSFTFRTPTVTLVTSYPSETTPQGLKPTVFAAFDQDVDPAAVMQTLRVTTDNHPVPFRLASSDEIEADKNIQAMSRQYGKHRWLALEPMEPLSPGHTYTVDIGVGTPSLEGPLKTRADQSFSFATYAPLAITYKPGEVPPLNPWVVNFNNPLDAATFDPATVKVLPELPGMKVLANGSSLMIRGRSKGNTTYTVTVPASLRDTFGQRFGHEEAVPVKVTPAQPAFMGPGQAFTVLDATGPRQLTCNVINYSKLRVRTWRVTPDDWAAYLNYLQNYRRNPKDLKTPGQPIGDSEIDTTAKPDEETEVKVDLSNAFRAGLGHVVVQITPLPEPKESYRQQSWVGWVQSTQIGLDAMADHDTLLGWASDLGSGKPLQGVELHLGKTSAATGADGLARLALGDTVPLLVAHKGDDVAILPKDFSYWYSNGWNRVGSVPQSLWHVVDDRKLYRPGEKVSLKGWLRRSTYGPKGDVTATPATGLDYELKDSRGNEILKGSAPIGRLGSFNFSLTLPKTVNLGQTQLMIRTNTGETTYHQFQVEEFRRPEFEVNAEATPASVIVGEHSSVTATAAYFAGGPLANAVVDWSVTSQPTTYSPPNWPEYTFGTWVPWWNYRSWWSPVEAVRDNSKSLQTHTDSAGKAILRADFDSVDPPGPSSVSAQATVQDVNRQAWSTTASILVHPSSLYVGLKSARTFVEQGQPLEMSALVSTIEGKAVAGKTILVKSYRLDWDGSWGEPRIKHADEHSLQLVSAATPVAFKIPPGAGGTYQIEARILDDQNRPNRSELTAWVAGGKTPPSRSVEQEPVTLIPSKKEYDPGETAEMLVQTPFAPAEIVVTTRRQGLAEVRRLSLPTGSATLQFPLKELYIPELTVQVDAVGSKVRTDANGTPLPGSPTRPAYASGTLNFAISKKSRKLTVEVTPAARSLQPGASTTVDVSVRDNNGRPVSSDVALIMVDESVLALTGYKFRDPLEAFAPVRSADVSDSHLRQFVMLSKIDAPAAIDELDGTQTEEGMLQDAPGMGRGVLKSPVMRSMAPMSVMAASAPMGFAKAKEGRADNRLREGEKSEDAANERKPGPAIRVRTNFTPLALFAPSLSTDADGHARVKVKLPDNLTRYRLVALAAAGDKQFGKGESSLTARQPLMARPSAPRFLNFGDRFQLPVVLQNQTDQAMQVSVACRATNAKLQQAGYKVTVPANNRVEVRFPAAADEAGTARFQFAATSSAGSDAAEISLPVWTPATSEAFATYGTIDDGAITQPIEKPKHVFEQFGGLTITTSSTALAELTDAYLYLASYPFECSEQVASRMLAAAALKDVLEAFKAPGMPSKASLNAAMARDLQRLKGQQNEDGGWDYWKREAPSVPFLSVHVLHTLVRVKAKGFVVDAQMLESALRYSTTIESHIPANYSESCKRAIRAYALYTLNLAGKPDVAKARALVKEAGGGSKLGFEMQGWLLPTLAKDPASAATVQEIFRYLDNHATQTAATAQFNSGYSDQDYLVLYSDRRDDAILLEALVQTRPNDPLIPKLVRGLLDHRTAGRWENTQENCWVLLALDEYFQKFESVTPDFVARVWLGQTYAGEQKFHGRSKDENALVIPMRQVASPVVISKEGKGRLYYRIGMKYAPTNLKLAPADYGFAVARTYEAAEGDKTLRRDAAGAWHVKAGSEVKVTVTMRASARRYHVALVDPMPAGLEALNPALLGSGDRAEVRTPSNEGWWSQFWFEHQNLRDERAEAFCQILWGGVYTYSYMARATTPGIFVVPPARAEEMYHPETFGRSGSDKFIVE